MYSQSFRTPCGNLTVTASEAGVTAVRFSGNQLLREQPGGVTGNTCEQLQAYFAGEVSVFDLPLDMQGTDFQKQVWQQLLQIGYGNTASYADIAARLNNPKAVRAVGMANSKNPIAIVVPCHRIIGSNGTLTGYAGGLERKRYLLNLEGVDI